MQIVVFEENGSKKNKIDGIERFGRGLHIKEIISITEHLPELIDEPEDYINDTLEADLVLSYLRHPDLVDHLTALCRAKKIALIAPGKKGGSMMTPFTCCGLGRMPQAGSYGEQFGFPEYRVELEGERISSITVIRGAPCGATWDILERMVGVTVQEAESLLPREIQYLCTADPSGFDPITGKSPVHYAGYVHRAALRKAIEKAHKASGFRSDPSAGS
jgi:hypothetical protein